MSKSKLWYYDLSRLIRIILAILPPVAFIVHAIARITTMKPLNILVGILGLIFGWNVLWIIDLISTIVLDKLFFC